MNKAGSKDEWLQRVLFQTRRPGAFRYPAITFISLCALWIIPVSGVRMASERSATIATGKKTIHEGTRNKSVGLFVQTSDQDYSKFIHTSQQHSSLSCNSCHERTDNAAVPRFPGHKACTNCHLSQFTTPAVPMCLICHTDTNSGNPPLRSFPANFKESFNVKFDHTQHMTGSAKPQNGCSGCHNRPLNRGVALSIPADLAAHAQCYTCPNRARVARSHHAGSATIKKPIRQRPLIPVHFGMLSVTLNTDRDNGCNAPPVTT